MLRFLSSKQSKKNPFIPCGSLLKSCWSQKADELNVIVTKGG